MSVLQFHISSHKLAVMKLICKDLSLQYCTKTMILPAAMHYPLYIPFCSAIPNEWVVNRSKEANVWRLAVAYQQHGHFKAHLDPLGLKAPITPYPLTAGAFGFSEGDEHRQFETEGILFAFQKPEASLKEITTYLEDTYCGTLAIETESIRVCEAVFITVCALSVFLSWLCCVLVNFVK